MLSYDLTKSNGPLYQYLYECSKSDILTGNLHESDRMPSKRAFAKNLGISTITVENAYEQLMAEGFMYSIPKKGYFVSELSKMGLRTVHGGNRKQELHIDKKRVKRELFFDFSSNQTGKGDFPFSVWAKMMRETISMKEQQLLTLSPCEGVNELRQAIAHHLASFRGMCIDPDQVVVGAGTEYLYSLLVKLLGMNRIYCIENPGYKKLLSIYESNGVQCRYANMDESGVIIEELYDNKVDIMHVSPTHHIPTGIVMPVKRRYELLEWANESAGRYIIEDDYDSEFRLKGKPMAPLMSMDENEKVVYMNTFSKTLTSTIRISYMVLPKHLANQFYEELSFYSNTVSTFEQYTLASFMEGGYLEKHINRMRLRYGKRRMEILNTIKKIFDETEYRVIENDSGLHFLLELNIQVDDSEFCRRLLERNVRINAISGYYMDENKKNTHQFIINYSNFQIEKLSEALLILRETMKNDSN